MGRWIEPGYIQGLTRQPAIRLLSPEQIETFLIAPAEALLSSMKELDLDCENEYLPRHWRGEFENDSDKLADWIEDIRKAAFFLCERASVNLDEFKSESSAGTTTAFGPIFPSAARSILARWFRRGRSSRSGRVFRA